MKEATLKQAGKVLEVIGETPCEKLQKLLGSGLFSDLLAANVELVNRDDFRKVIGLKPLGMNAMIANYPMQINYDRSVEDGIKAGKYDWKNDDITSEHFPSQETGTKNVVVELFHYGKDISTDEVLADLDKQGYRAATLKELLALGEKYPDDLFLIIALDSVWQSPDGRLCSSLSRSGSLRFLDLFLVARRWYDDCGFAAVRK